MEIFFNTFQEVCDGVKDVLILAATNTPFALDQAIRRRFDKRIYVPLPDPEARKQIFEIRIGNTPKTISDTEFEDLAKATDGFSGSDISYFEIDKKGENSKIEVQPCSAEHFENVRRNHKATVTKDDLEKFDEFTNKFGIYG
nr:protein suppressor of k(+) transport growth defect 1 [Quercus suber]